MCGIFFTNGQICSATSRLLVHQDIADKLLERLALCTASIPIVSPLDPAFKERTGTLGPVVNKAQYERVLNYIHEAIKEGAQLVTGGGRSTRHTKGYYIQPTILKVTPKMKIFQEEVFGPVLSVVTFKDEAEAIRLANTTDYGLAGAVFSEDIQRCERLVRALRVGITWVNCSQPTFIQLPWGGVKRSGIGRECGEMGIHEYLEPKQVTCAVNSRKPLGWYFLPPQPPQRK